MSLSSKIEDDLIAKRERQLTQAQDEFERLRTIGASYGELQDAAARVNGRADALKALKKQLGRV